MAVPYASRFVHGPYEIEMLKARAVAPTTMARNNRCRTRAAADTAVAAAADMGR
jgi:hypothetical protein